MKPPIVPEQTQPSSPAHSNTWNHDSRDEFYEYYANGSLSKETSERFRRLRDMTLRVIPQLQQNAYAVADIGCGAGVQSLLWAEMGHEVHGVDVNARLLELARQRAASSGSKVEFQVGSATSLPWPDGSMDVCLVVELLEHVADWKTCLNEFARVLRPNGVLLLTTTNCLCPIQAEFRLPLYSWYPSPLKRYCEQLALTSKPWLANHATYPAVTWFSFYQLKRELNRLGFSSMDRFDVLDTSAKGMPSKMIIELIRKIGVLRWLGHVATSGTLVLAIKRS